MKIDEVRSKTDAELEFDLGNMMKELFDLRIKAATENIQNPARTKVLRRANTRIRTVLHERKNAIRGQESK